MTKAHVYISLHLVFDCACLLIFISLASNLVSLWISSASLESLHYFFTIINYFRVVSALNASALFYLV